MKERKGVVVSLVDFPFPAESSALSLLDCKLREEEKNPHFNFYYTIGFLGCKLLS
jgi:hypothetical protein